MTLKGLPLANLHPDVRAAIEADWAKNRAEKEG
jgi:hypothetical protein